MRERAASLVCVFFMWLPPVVRWCFLLFSVVRRVAMLTVLLDRLAMVTFNLSNVSASVVIPKTACGHLATAASGFVVDRYVLPA